MILILSLSQLNDFQDYSLSLVLSKLVRYSIFFSFNKVVGYFGFATSSGLDSINIVFIINNLIYIINKKPKMNKKSPKNINNNGKRKGVNSE